MKLFCMLCQFCLLKIVSGLEYLEGNRLKKGEQLYIGQEILSENGKYSLAFRLDGDLVISFHGFPIQKIYNGSTGARLSMETNGNLVIYDKNYESIWESGTANIGNSLLVQDNGYIIIVNSKGQTVWSQKTFNSINKPFYKQSFAKRRQFGKGNWLSSRNEKYVLLMEDNGHLVLYPIESEKLEIWGIYFEGQGNRFVLEKSGNMIMYNENQKVIWESRTNSGEYLKVENVGQLVLYDVNGKRVWASNEPQIEFEYLKWSNKVSEKYGYFEKVAKNKWNEYHEYKLFGQFTEIEQYDDENGNLVVILERTDGLYVKLTKSESYWGNNKTEINNFNVQGYWFTPVFIQADKYDYLKWSNLLSEKYGYFEKITKDIWYEYHEYKLFGQFTEIEQYNDINGNLVVILKRTDDLYIKLTNGSCYWGNSKSEINNFNVEGYWSVKKKNESPITPIIPYSTDDPLDTDVPPTENQDGKGDDNNGNSISLVNMGYGPYRPNNH